MCGSAIFGVSESLYPITVRSGADNHNHAARYGEKPRHGEIQLGVSGSNFAQNVKELYFLLRAGGQILNWELQEIIKIIPWEAQSTW